MFLTVGPQKSSFCHSPEDNTFPSRVEGQDQSGMGFPGGSVRLVPHCPRSESRCVWAISHQPMEGGGSLIDLGERKASSFWGHCWCFINDKGCKTPPLSLQLMLKLNFLPTWFVEIPCNHIRNAASFKVWENN